MESHEKIGGMDMPGYILIGFGVAIVLFVIIFLTVRWYVERKKLKALAKKDLIERSFISPQTSVCKICFNV
jgi:hypothetical protein